MNDSISAISPDWPTRWPKDSFKGVWTWFLAGFDSAAVRHCSSSCRSSYPPPTKTSRRRSSTSSDRLQMATRRAAGCNRACSPFRGSRNSACAISAFAFPTARRYAIALCGAVAMFVVGRRQRVAHRRAPRPAPARHRPDIPRAARPHDDRIFAVFAIVFAPFAEETLFRLFFFNLGLRYGGFWAGAIVSGLLFGIAHGDPYEAIPLALGGIVLCAVYYVRVTRTPR